MTMKEFFALLQQRQPQPPQPQFGGSGGGGGGGDEHGGGSGGGLGGQGGQGGQVAYLSYQNDSLREQFAPLRADVPPCLDFARDALGNAPDAVNLWIGDGRAVTTAHVDHYENLWVRFVHCLLWRRC